MELLTDQPEKAPVAGLARDLSTIPGSSPLRNRFHERYARECSLLCPKIEAYRRAFGYVNRELTKEETHALRGNASRVERRQDVRDRVAYLSRQPEEILQAKRARLEEFLWLIHETNYADLWEIAEKPKYDAEGEPVIDDDGKPVMTHYQRLKFLSELPEELQRAVEALKYTDSGKPQLSVYSKIEANKELRKLLGIGMNADDSRGEFETMSDHDLIANLERQARELGVNVTLTYGIAGGVR